MLAVMRLYLIKHKRVPLIITGILVILLLWVLVIKALADPNSPATGRVDLGLTNFGLLIFIYIGMIKRESMAKDGFVLRLPVSDKEIVIANILALSVISIITVALSLFSIYAIIGFYKLAGFTITISYEKFKVSDIWSFAYYIMYMGVLFSIYTFLLQYRAKNNSKLIMIGVPIALLFLVPTILAIVMHSTHIVITDKMWEDFFSNPFWQGVRQVFYYLWKVRLVLGLLFTVFLYRLRYLKEI